MRKFAVVLRAHIQESLDDSRGVLPKIIGVVATFKHNEHLRTNLEKLLGHVIVAKWTELRLTKRVMDC